MPRPKGTRNKKTEAKAGFFDLPEGDSSEQTLNKFVEPKFVGEAIASDDTPRRGRSRIWSPQNGFKNIDNSRTPFTREGNFFNSDTKRCVKAYWAFALLKSTVDTITELANSAVYLTGGNQKTRDFVGAWFDRIGIWKLKEEFFREFFRSGNFIAYRFDAEYQPGDLVRMTQVFGAMNGKEIPVRYIVLNPEDIRVGGNISFQDPMYYKVLTNYELERIRNPKTEEDKAVRASLDPKALAELSKGTVPFLRLNPEKIHAVFHKRQDYEPLGVPFYYPLLEDIDAKMELKRIDRKFARQAERALLLVTAGNEPAKGGVNFKTIESLQTLFANESVMRTLVADYTVKAEFVEPDLNKVLGKLKYEQLDKDIREGLGAILFDGAEKFASASLKVQILMERLKEARSAFINEFLQPEIKRICKIIGARVYPTIEFEEINLRDELQYSKIYTTMAQIGLLTPQELFTAMESGKLPTAEDSIESQKAYKKSRDSGLYMPLVGGPKEGEGAGRPAGTKAPQSTKKVSPVGTSSASFSPTKLKDVAMAADELKGELFKKVCRKHKIKELNESQEAVANLVIQSIMANEPVDKWKTSIASYLKAPKDINEEFADEVDDICFQHNVDSFLGTILNLSKVEEAKTEEKV